MSAKQAQLGGVIFHNPGAFWFGVMATSVGVMLHLPMYISGRTMGYHLSGMPMDIPMMIGMFLVVLGFASSFYGLYPPASETNSKVVSRISVRAIDEAKITKTMWHC